MRDKFQDLFGATPETTQKIKEQFCYKTFSFEIGAISVSTYHVPMASRDKLELTKKSIDSLECINKNQYKFRSTRYIFKEDSFESKEVRRVDYFLNDPRSNLHIFAPTLDSFDLILLDIAPYWEGVYSLQLTNNISHGSNIYSFCAKILTQYGMFYCELYDCFLKQKRIST
jgi:hypothetical protein